MALQGLIKPIEGLAAASDLSALQFRGVSVATTGKMLVGAPGAAGADAIGILQNKPAAGQAAEVAGPGSVCKAEADAAFDENVLLTVQQTTGRLLTASSTNFIVARALEQATAQGQIVTVLVLAAGAKV